jgi:hypothetical protein
LDSIERIDQEKEGMYSVKYEDCDQHETSFLVYMEELVRDEHPIEILLQQEEHLLVQSEDDLSHSLVMIPWPNSIPQVDS